MRSTSVSARRSRRCHDPIATQVADADHERGHDPPREREHDDSRDEPAPDAHRRARPDLPRSWIGAGRRRMVGRGEQDDGGDTGECRQRRARRSAGSSEPPVRRRTARRNSPASRSRRRCRADRGASCCNSSLVAESPHLGARDTATLTEPADLDDRRDPPCRCRVGDRVADEIDVDDEVDRLGDEAPHGELRQVRVRLRHVVARAAAARRRRRGHGSSPAIPACTSTRRRACRAPRPRRVHRRPHGRD